MIGLTRLLGLAYGGPGFHDVISSEVALADTSDYPLPKYSVLFGMTHEICHAQGWTRELDAEVLTYLSMWNSKDPLMKSLSGILLLQKAGVQVDFPPLLVEERDSAKETTAIALEVEFPFCHISR